MIRKIIILGLVIFAAVWFYKKFMADIMGTFFSQHKNNVDFIQKKVPDYNIENK